MSFLSVFSNKSFLLSLIIIGIIFACIKYYAPKIFEDYSTTIYSVAGGAAAASVIYFILTEDVEDVDINSVDKNVLNSPISQRSRGSGGSLGSRVLSQADSRDSRLRVKDGYDSDKELLKTF